MTTNCCGCKASLATNRQPIGRCPSCYAKLARKATRRNTLLSESANVRNERAQLGITA